MDVRPNFRNKDALSNFSDAGVDGASVCLTLATSSEQHEMM